MKTSSDDDLTGQLQAWSDGDLDALDTLLPMVFEDLHRMALHFFQRESHTHTLQATALVSELYLKLRGQRKTTWDSREDFFLFAAEVMRRLLVDYSRRRRAEKRGSGLPPLPLELVIELGQSPEVDLDFLDLEKALVELEQIDPQQARIVELRFLMGLQVDEVTEFLGLSESTVKRDWRTAKIWLARRLAKD